MRLDATNNHNLIKKGIKYINTFFMRFCMLTDNNKIVHRKKILAVFLICTAIFVLLFGRLIYLMVWKADHYSRMADELHERERSIKAARGRILDRNGEVLADNKTVCTVSVIYSQIEDPEAVIEMLVR